LRSIRIASLAMLVLLAAALPALADDTQTAIFAGGCFWCEESAFDGLPGVVAAISGYTGGHTKDPSYEEVSSGTTGHAESSKVVFDPKKVTYEKLLDVYWHNVDPFDGDGQFCDRGSQYRPAIFYLDETQKKAAEASKRKLEEDPKFKGKIAVQIVAASAFYPAEEYYQDYCKKKPTNYNLYRYGCRRDARLKAVWGDAAGGHK